MKRVVYLVMVILLLTGLSLASCGGGSVPPQEAKKSEAAPATVAPTQATKKGDPAVGEKSFASICAACHGPTGKGIQGLGKDMTTSEFIAGKTDDELVAFIKVGRDPSDPLNTTGVAMPPKGGNPAFNDDDLYNIVAYIRTIHK